MCRAQELLSSALLRAPAVLHSLLSHARHVIFSGSTFFFFGLVLVFIIVCAAAPAGGRGPGRAHCGCGGVLQCWGLGVGPLKAPRYRDIEIIVSVYTNMCVCVCVDSTNTP